MKRRLLSCLIFFAAWFGASKTEICVLSHENCKHQGKTWITSILWYKRSPAICLSSLAISAMNGPMKALHNNAILAKFWWRVWTRSLAYERSLIEEQREKTEVVSCFIDCCSSIWVGSNPTWLGYNWWIFLKQRWSSCDVLHSEVILIVDYNNVRTPTI